METEIKTHDTVVIGQDETGKVTFMKTFDSEIDREQMLLAYDHVHQFGIYRMCEISRIKLEDEL